jgi:tetratricopeptide (TPR) repeat protein
MPNGAHFRQKARAFEQRENWKRAIEACEHAIEADKKARKDVDLGLYNRIGDLYRRIGDVNKAVHYYELAADGHLAAGFYNNAIALCNKILRNQPNRHSAYLKLGKIGAAKGFLSDARRHFLEYAERMQRAGQLDAAFAALIEFADLSPDPEVRLMIVEQLIEHERERQAVDQLRLAWRDLREEGREADAADVRERVLAMAPERDPEVHPPEAASSGSMDAEGVIDLPILAYDDPEGEEREEATAVAPAYEEPADEAEDFEQVGVGVEPEAPDVEPFDVEPADETLGMMPTTLADQEAVEEEPALEEDLDFELVPTSLVADELDEELLEGVTAEELEGTLDMVGDASEEAGVGKGDEPGYAATALDEPAEEPLAAEAVVTPADRVVELESRLGAEGQRPELLVELAEALLETGNDDKATHCLSQALDAFERQGQYREAERVIDELLRLDVNSMLAYQKRVELAFRAGDRGALIEAYLGLADCLDRSDASNKARAVYARVLELDPVNRRAAAALEMFGKEPAAVERAAEASARAAAATAAEGYVDLGSLVIEPDARKRRTTRFRVPATDPKSEADVNFSALLDQFKSMVSEAIEEEDAASHYDLGVAYKEMGLIDEAIAEFQIAARGTEYRLRAIEMLGACFSEKGEERIALKVLGRALQVEDYRDEDLIGIFYAMGRAYEALGESTGALEWYERVVGCDVNFRDVARRVAALRH